MIAWSKALGSWHLMFVLVQNLSVTWAACHLLFILLSINLSIVGNLILAFYFNVAFLENSDNKH